MSEQWWLEEEDDRLASSENFNVPCIGFSIQLYCDLSLFQHVRQIPIFELWVAIDSITSSLGMKAVRIPQ